MSRFGDFGGNLIVASVYLVGFLLVLYWLVQFVKWAWG